VLSSNSNGLAPKRSEENMVGLCNYKHFTPNGVKSCCVEYFAVME